MTNVSANVSFQPQSKKQSKSISKKLRKIQEFEKRLKEKEFERAFFREFWPDNVWHALFVTLMPKLCQYLPSLVIFLRSTILQAPMPKLCQSFPKFGYPFNVLLLLLSWWKWNISSVSWSFLWYTTESMTRIVGS